MRSKPVRAIAFFGLASVGFCQTAAPLLIRDVRLFDGERVLEHRTVLVENGKIAGIEGSRFDFKGAETIEGQGRTLLPGLLDAHVHISPANVEGALGQAVSLGVTTVLDMFTNAMTLQSLKRIQSADPPTMADVRTAGIGATALGGHPTEMGGPSIPTIISAEQAEAFVDARIEEGSDYIKIIYDDLAWALGGGRVIPKLSPETLRALVQAAHKKNRLAVVHIGTELQAREAIDAGADGLAHMFTGESAGDDFGKLAASHHVFVIPTLVTLYSTCGESNGPMLLKDPHLEPFIRSMWRDSLERPWPLAKTSCKATLQGVRQLVLEHVPILAGTDAPSSGTTYGASLHDELVQLVGAGLTPVQALAAATSVPARMFHLDDRGSIHIGMRADLVLVEGDASRDIHATRNIIAVWKRGIRVQR